MKNFSLVCSNQRIFKEKENFESFVRIEQYRKTGIFFPNWFKSFHSKEKRWWNFKCKRREGKGGSKNNKF